jgi:hypothetical protein
MRWLFFVLIVVHGLFHFVGFAKGFGLAQLTQLAQPVSKSAGTAWLIAGVALLVTAMFFTGGKRVWWMVGLGAVVLSQVLIVSSWGDAKFVTISNALVVAGIVYGFASQGPLSFRADYLNQVHQRMPQTGSTRIVTEADLVALPELVRRYVRLTKAVGQPVVHHFKATWRGRIRSTSDDPWMEFTAEQYNFPGEPARFFLMRARKGGLPVDVYHSFRKQSATMRVRLLSLIPLVDASGPEPDRAELVTLLNDMCLLAPSSLVNDAIGWESIDDRSVRAHYTIGANTISAVLIFNEGGELVNFFSDDRLAASPDGREFTRQRWSTPVRDYRNFGPLRVCARGEGRWHSPEGEFVYIELELLDLQINGAEANLES